MPKDYVLYHAGCADGFGSAYAAWTVLRDEAEYLPVSYGYPPPDLKDARNIYLLDFAYPLEELEKLKAQASGEFVVIDHHKTNTHLEDLDYAIYEQDRSGAVLAWDYFQEGDKPTPALLEYIEDRDLWKWNLEYSSEINAALQSYPKSFDVWIMLDTRMEMEIMGLIDEGQAILRFQNQLVESIVRNAQPTDFYGYKGVPVVVTPILHSEVGHALLQKYPDAPFSVTYRDTIQGKLDLKPVRTYSLRSEDSREDVSKIAKENGGGGHRNASGFETELTSRVKYGGLASSFIED